jgi:glyoxylate reductase
LAKAPHLKVVGQASAGYDNIDLAACKARHVRVGNTPKVLVNAVADMAYGLIFDTARMLAKGDRHVRSGAWGEKKGLGFGVDLYGKTLGIVGMGSIGSAVVKRAQASGMQVIYHNRHERKDAAGAKYVSFDELLQTADFILVCVDLNASTEKMFNDAAFAKMKQGARFVNISRGKVVDTDALVKAVECGKLAAVALDVTDPEPLPESSVAEVRQCYGYTAHCQRNGRNKRCHGGSYRGQYFGSFKRRGNAFGNKIIDV